MSTTTIAILVPGAVSLIVALASIGSSVWLTRHTDDRAQSQWERDQQASRVVWLRDKRAEAYEAFLTWNTTPSEQERATNQATTGGKLATWGSERVNSLFQRYWRMPASTEREEAWTQITQAIHGELGFDD
jgi:hypothetical protein